MSRFDLTDFERTVIAPLLPNNSRGVRRVDDRRVLSGIFWALCAGAPWRDLPERYGPYTTVYNRFNRWRKAGVWDCIMDAITRAHDSAVQMIDTSVLRVHQHAAGARKGTGARHMGRSRGGLTTKIHAVVDGNGLPLRLALTPGQEHDITLAAGLLVSLESRSIVLADRAYDADAIRALVNEQDAFANIPPKRNRKEPVRFDPLLYRSRNRIERFFNKLKHFRRIATRYDKLADNYLAALKLASVRLWLRVYESTP